jgi:peptidoglycan/xylan/chitin deacetylase (PgdA/CDA1 family)
MSWDEVRVLASSPLCTIGAHTVTHPRLAGLDEEEVVRELAVSRQRIEAELARPARHLAYPYGGKDAAGAREFRVAAELGFASAVTTRPGVLHPEHAAHLTALPRIPVNGEWQDARALEALLSGLPIAAWSRGRRLDVA